MRVGEDDLLRMVGLGTSKNKWIIDNTFDNKFNEIFYEVLHNFLNSQMDTC